MKKIWDWVLNNPNRAMFLIPILLVAGISISHVVTWYDIANPINWAIYLSIAIEVGAMTALVAATNKIKGGVWFMFGLVTFIQMIGNIFYSYHQIDETGELFQSWIELTSPVWELMGTEITDVVGMKRWLAFLEGGLLPLISLTSLHFFVNYEKGEINNEEDNQIERKEKSDSQIVEKNNNAESNFEVVTDVPHKNKEELGTDLEKEENKVWVKVNELKEEGKLPETTEEAIEDEPTALDNSAFVEEELPYDESDDEEWDEDHALDMVMNEMVEDLGEELKNLEKEIEDVLDNETVVEEVKKEKTNTLPTTKQDVTVNNKIEKKKMGIDRIR